MVSGSTFGLDLLALDVAVLSGGTTWAASWWLRGRWRVVPALVVGAAFGALTAAGCHA